MTTRTSAPVRGTKKAAKQLRGRKPVLQPELPRAVTIKELDPIRKCGPGTSVQHMFRVDESFGGRHADTHLVFFDRHGWYCVHGATCRAVDDVRKQGGYRHIGLHDNR